MKKGDKDQKIEKLMKKGDKDQNNEKFMKEDEVDSRKTDWDSAMNKVNEDLSKAIWWK